MHLLGEHQSENAKTLTCFSWKHFLRLGMYSSRFHFFQLYFDWYVSIQVNTFTKYFKLISFTLCVEYYRRLSNLYTHYWMPFIVAILVIYYHPTHNGPCQEKYSSQNSHIYIIFELSISYREFVILSYSIWNRAPARRQWNFNSKFRIFSKKIYDCKV